MSGIAVLITWICRLDTLFRALGENVHPDSDWTDAVYPPVFVRRSLVGNALVDFLHAEGRPELAGEVAAAKFGPEVLRVTETMTCRLFGQPGDPGIFRRYFDKTKQHVDKLKEVGAKLGPRRDEWAPVAERAT